MNTSSSTVHITLELPKEICDRAMQTADDRHCPVEALLTDIIDEGLQAYDAEQLWEKMAEAYRDRLAQSGKLNQSTEEVLEDLAVIREQVANEFHPG
ncbi:MAG: hypothetical protein WBA57_26415 [Elainellaceae cyanobacterium]